jgi:23S rRNA pseudouridine2605 synthase
MAGPASSNGDRSASGRVRLQRVMADAGVAARRVCEQMIEDGQVEVNGRRVRTLPVFVDPQVDRIVVSGRPLVSPDRRIYVMLNKPPRTLSTAHDEPGAARRTVVDLVRHPSGVRLFPVGRLDYDTLGLVLLTNDGDLANRLSHPRYEIEKTYHAVVKGRVDEASLARLEKGMFLADRREGRTVGGRRASHVGLRIKHVDRERTVLEISLREGQNRQVRRMLAKAGHPVRRLTRVAMGPLKLRGLASGQWRELSGPEVAALRRAADKAKRRAPSPDDTSSRPS